MATISSRRFRGGGGRIAAGLLVALLAPAAAGAQADEWLRSTTAPASVPAYLGNGRFSLAGSPLGTEPAPSFVAGVFERGADDIPRITALPAWNEIDIDVGNGWLNRMSPQPELGSYRQTLDIARGVLETHYTSGTGTAATDVTVRAYVSRADSLIGVVELALTPHAAGPIRLRFPLRAWPEPRRMPLARLERLPEGMSNRVTWYPGHVAPIDRDVEIRADGARLLLTGRIAGSPLEVAEAAVVLWPADLRRRVVQRHIDADEAAVELRFDAEAGRTYLFHKLVAVAALESGAAAVARAAAEAATAAGPARLLAEHVRAWNELWRTDIVIEGDAELQRVARSMLYHLLSSVREGQDHSVGPMGLSSGGYYGHVFWDADTWIFPPLLVLHPELARSIVRFRARTLPAALENARLNGFRGAMYPWEAGGAGEETTPRFAWQNALKEIHVNGDVALAQWQYFQATGDTAFLREHGYPVLRATAEFWMSRVRRNERGGFDIPDVVSVAEDEIGVANETYTNAVARLNLELAARAAELLGEPVDRAWHDVAARIVIPFDSAGHYHPTYEGAPRETLGSVVTLLSYPLRVPMSDTAKANNLRHAIAGMARHGRGAMMTTTLYAVLAAELGDRALMDELVPQSWQGYVHPPFDVLSETPDNDAYNFITGAGGFLHQVLFGWTGLRLGDEGLEAVYPPLLPSGVQRLELRNLSVHGRQVDVVVEGGTLHVRPHRTARAPVLEFPQAGIDDAAAYQGYRTRLFRDSRDNTFQVYVDRDGRVVHLWADAANESLSFSARDAQRLAALPVWDDTVAWVSESDGERVVAHRLRHDGAELRLGHFLLGSMREERDFQYQEADLRPLDAAAWVLPEPTSLVDELALLPSGERAEHLRLLSARDVDELRARLAHALTLSSADGEWALTVERPSLDARNRLVLEVRGDARRSSATLESGVLAVRSLDGSPIRFSVIARTDAEALHPLDRADIFTGDFLAYLERARVAAEAAAARGTVAGDAVIDRHRRLERGVRGVELLSSREKLMAGLPNFATYFGRDMMMTALMMRPIWRAEMIEHVLGAVLGKVAADGDVSHEEALGGQAIRENAAEYAALLREARAGRAAGQTQASDSLLLRARERLANLQQVRENHHMLDDDFQLPVLAARYLADARLDRERRRRFLLEEIAGEPRIVPLLRNLALVAERTAPYARSGAVAELVSFQRREDGGWSSSSWRDSGAGYGGGRYAMDVNAIWAPAALEATRSILVSLEEELGWTVPELTALVPESEQGALGEWLRSRERLATAIATWREAGGHFQVTLEPDELRAGFADWLATATPAEHAHWRRIGRSSGALDRPLTFPALALDASGQPIRVVNTDPATRLMLEDLTDEVLSGALSADAVLGIVEPFLRPFPVGLLIEAVGNVVANDVFAAERVRRGFEADTYHSPQVVWGREVNLFLLGTARQVESAFDERGELRHPALEPYVRELRDALAAVSDAVDASGLRHLELWSYEVGVDGVRPVRYGFSSDVQLWNVTDLAVRYTLDALP
ncbi:MAG TPA: hypothetical protein VMN78_04120 [Longimicrobiales bacterium]|nr:hypothetical protein [Longimicrobiales bacterium]